MDSTTPDIGHRYDVMLNGFLVFRGECIHTTGHASYLRGLDIPTGENTTKPFAHTDVQFIPTHISPTHRNEARPCTTTP